MLEMQRQKGFTLLEVILAVTILATALLLLSASWSAAFQRVRKAQLNFEIASLMERKMLEVEIKYRGKSLDEISEEDGGDFGDKYPQYTWKLKSKKLEVPDIAATLASQEGGAKDELVTVVKQLTESLSKSVKEVRVTIVYKPKDGKPLEYDVTTYFVNYDTPISMGGPPGS